MSGGLAQKDPAGTQSEIKIKQPGKDYKPENFWVRSTYGCTDIAPSHRIPIGKVDTLLMLHAVTGYRHMSNICKPQSYHIISYHLGLSCAIENRNTDHSE